MGKKEGPNGEGGSEWRRRDLMRKEKGLNGKGET